MRIPSIHLAVAVGIALAAAPIASAQTVFNPILASPFARPTVTPYLNLTTGGTAASTYYMGVLREFDYRNQLARPPVELGVYDISRTPGYQTVATYQGAEDFVNQRIRETQLSPTGHPTGFLVPSPFYRLPNQRSFLPHNPNTAQPSPQPR